MQSAEGVWPPHRGKPLNTLEHARYDQLFTKELVAGNTEPNRARTLVAARVRGVAFGERPSRPTRPGGPAATGILTAKDLT